MSSQEIQAIVNAIGADRYQTACLAAQQAAEDFGDAEFDHTRNPALDADLPHEIGFLVMDSPLAPEHKMAQLLQIYHDLPVYGILYVINIYWFDFGPAGHELFWRDARRILSQDEEPLAKPLEYSLAVDFFADVRTVDDAWRALVQDQASPTLLRRVLANAGFVPSPLRESLYARLISDPTWHVAILHSLFDSRDEYHEPVDKQRAALILQQLHLPAETPYLRELRTFLQ